MKVEKEGKLEGPRAGLIHEPIHCLPPAPRGAVANMGGARRFQKKTPCKGAPLPRGGSFREGGAGSDLKQPHPPPRPWPTGQVANRAGGEGLGTSKKNAKKHKKSGGKQRIYPLLPIRPFLTSRWRLRYLATNQVCGLDQLAGGPPGWPPTNPPPLKFRPVITHGGRWVPFGAQAATGHLAPGHHLTPPQGMRWGGPSKRHF